MFIVGIDLSGPTNTQDTVCAAFKQSRGHLHLCHTVLAATDEMIFNLTAELAAQSVVIVGLDAPLSYNPGGGDRPSDKALRQQITPLGLHPGSIMTPTMTRMAYLTLRGISVARLLQTIIPVPQIVEVHPGATLALHGAPIPFVRTFKHETMGRRKLLIWLEQQGLQGTTASTTLSDHMVAAYAAAFAAWKWANGKNRWLAPAAPPLHPFDFAC